MKNLNLSFKNVAIIATACLTLSFGSLFMQNHFNGKSQKMAALSGGVGTCFTRVTQTFTALMIQDFSSVYMKSEFMSNTQECFNIANTEFNLLWGKTFKDGYKNITQIVSDLHWYHEKAQKLKKMVSEGGVALTNSNIINKYSELEALKNNFTDAVDKKLESTQFTTLVWFAISFTAFAFFMMIATIFGVQLKQRKENFDLIENEMSSSSEELTAARLDRVLENVFTKLEMPNTYQAINNYVSNLLEREYAGFEKDDDEIIHKITPAQKVVKANFHDAMTTVLGHLQTKAFTHGIVVDSELDDEFDVKGDQEALGQFLFSVVNYAAENSLLQKEGRKIALKCKPLGGTAYLKVSIANYCFNASELNYLNSTENTHSDINMNLVLMKELMVDLGVSVAVKNKTTASHSIEGCEIELIFERIKAREANKDITVVKGTKKEILRAMQSEA